MKFIDCNHQANIIHQYVEEQLHHSYLKEYIDHPYIDRDRIHFLLLPFAEANGDISLEEVQWISTAMLLQIALDTHEKVTNSEFDPLKEGSSRSLPECISVVYITKSSLKRMRLI